MVRVRLESSIRDCVCLGRRHLRWLHRRSKGIDRTPYDNPAACGGGGKPFVQYWTQRLSAAVVAGDARRALTQRDQRVCGPFFFLRGLAPWVM